MTYNEIELFLPNLSSHLRDFSENLYSQNFLSLKSVSNRIGKLDKENGHFFEFMKINKKGKCPFCGISDMKGIYHSKREAYDHYLPKAIYPFNSINFRNLAPACHECNSSYKLSKNPIYCCKSPLSSNSGARRKSFYPYQTENYSIQLEIALDCQDWTDLKPDNIEIKVGPNEYLEELEAWLDIYGIEERYKAKCCGKNDGKYWIEQVWDESKNYEMQPQEIINIKKAASRKFALCRSQFFKKSFFRGVSSGGVV